MDGRRQRRGRRRGLRFWPLLGLMAAGAVGAVAVALLSRRTIDLGPEREEEEDLVEEAPHRPESADDDRSAPVPAAAPSPSDLAVWIAGPSGNLFVRDGGQAGGMPILFVHSLGGNGGQWALQLDDLRPWRRAAAVDLRGHGDSDPADDGDYSIAGLAADVAAAADQLALRRFALAGHSLGATVAIEYASRHPERVSGLLLVDPNGDQSRLPREQVDPFLAALRADPLRELESYFRQLLVGGDRDAAGWVIEDLRLTHEDAIAKAVESAVAYPPLPALARYPGPKLSIISDMNSLPVSLHRLLPDLPVHLMRGTGHWLMMDRPEAFNQLLDEFLDVVDRA